MNIVISSAKIIKKHTKLALGIMIGLVVGGSTSVAVLAAIPDNSGLIHACYRTGLLNNGQIRVIDSPGQSCNVNESALTLNTAAPGNFVTNLQGADFHNADLRYRNFAGANLTGVNFQSAFLNGATFNKANLTNAIIESTAVGVNFTDATFNNTQIFNGDLSNSNFSNTTFYNSIIGSTDVTNVNFTNTHFNQAGLVGTNATNAILTGATWTNTQCPDNTNSNDHGNTCVGHLVP